MTGESDTPYFAAGAELVVLVDVVEQVLMDGVEVGDQELALLTFLPRTEEGAMWWSARLRS